MARSDRVEKSVAVKIVGTGHSFQETLRAQILHDDRPTPMWKVALTLGVEGL